MVSKKEKRRMKDYVSQRIENSGVKITKDIDRNSIEIKTNLGNTGYVFLHTSPLGYEDFLYGKNKFHDLVYNKIPVANIFYKDGINFFVGLTDNEKNILSSRSMKEYSYNEICHMIKLKRKEQEVLRLSGKKRLTYYQPSNIEEGGRLEEGLVSFGFRQVYPSYSHYPEDKKGFDFVMADDGNRLLRRWISQDKKILDGKLRFLSPKKSPHILSIDNSLDTTRNTHYSEIQIENFRRKRIEDFLRENGKTLEDFGGDVLEYLEYQ